MECDDVDVVSSASPEGSGVLVVRRLPTVADWGRSRRLPTMTSQSAMLEVIGTSCKRVFTMTLIILINPVFLMVMVMQQVQRALNKLNLVLTVISAVIL
jgi:hypothetical protein